MSLHVITGPMRAGKTLDLIESVRRSRANRIKTLVFTHKLAARVHGKRLMSRTGAVVRATPVESAEDIIQAAKDAKPGSVIIIDEAHFFNLDDAERIVSSLARRFGLLVAGLDTDFRGESFPSVAYLIAAADSVTRLTATCARCGAPATRTQRLINGEPAPWTSPVIMPGGDDMYEPRCVACHEAPGRPNPKRPKQRGDTR